MAVAPSDGRQFGIEKYRGIIRLSVLCTENLSNVEYQQIAKLHSVTAADRV